MLLLVGFILFDDDGDDRNNDDIGGIDNGDPDTSLEYDGIDVLMVAGTVIDDCEGIALSELTKVPALLGSVSDDNDVNDDADVGMEEVDNDNAFDRI
jgi:hypothetical protein